MLLIDKECYIIMGNNRTTIVCDTRGGCLDFPISAVADKSIKTYPTKKSADMAIRNFWSHPIDYKYEAVKVRQTMEII